jgi:hypothetical protein
MTVRATLAWVISEFTGCLSRIPGTTTGTYWFSGIVVVLKGMDQRKRGGTCDQTQLAWSSDEFHSHAVMFMRRIGCGQAHFIGGYIAHERKSASEWNQQA